MSAGNNNTIKNFCYFDYEFWLDGVNYDGYDSDPGEDQPVDVSNEGFGKYTFVGYSIPEDYLERIRKAVHQHILEKHRCRRIKHFHIRITNIRPNGSFLPGDEHLNLDFDHVEKPDIERYMCKSYIPLGTNEVKGKNSDVHVNNADVEDVADVDEDEYIEPRHNRRHRDYSNFYQVSGRIIRNNHQ
jgi:hypothetical protein